MSIRSFNALYASAVLHKGSARVVEEDLPHPKSAAELRQLSDDRYLSVMSRRVFHAGLTHSVVDNKWLNFERTFYGFDPFRVAMMSDDDVDVLMRNTAIIRHLNKIKAVRANAVWMLDVIAEYGSFAALIADWDSRRIVELWSLLKKHGAQLGGMSASRFLRMVGKDTFLLTNDVVAVLKADGVIIKPPTSQRDLLLVQDVFNGWADESGRSLAEISRIISYTAG